MAQGGVYSARALTVVGVSVAVVDRDDLHPLLTVQIIVQFLRAQLQSRAFIILKVGRQTKFFGLRSGSGVEQRVTERARGRLGGRARAHGDQAGSRNRDRHRVLREQLLPVLDVGRVHFEESRTAGLARLQHVRHRGGMMDSHVLFLTEESI